MRVLSLVCLVFASACAVTALSQAGSKVSAVGAPPSAECQSLGTVVGQSGGFFNGAWTTNENLATGAVNDAFNKAAALGATHLQVSPPQFASNSGTTNAATVTGVAYKCPPGTPAPAQSAVQK